MALILLSTKALGLLTRKMNMPQVVGALLAGLILGPGLLGWITQTDYIAKSAEIGVVVLMFCAGLETDVAELKKAGKASFVIALMGVLLPLAGGFAVSFFFNRPGIIDSDAGCSLFLQNLFVGVILTATSVSITVEALREIGMLFSPAGSAILGAAVIDDVLGIIALTIITSFADSRVKIGVVFLKILGFFAFSLVVSFVFYFWFEKMCLAADRPRKRHAITVLVFCLIMSYCSERFFGVADITAAFAAGLVVSLTPFKDYLIEKFDVVSSLYLSPIFFASIGLKVVLPEMSGTVLVFAVLLTFIAALSKVAGCGLGAKLMDYSSRESLQIGVGMISRGEIALIVADKGTSLGLISSQLIGPVVVVVIATTIVTPISLKAVFAEPQEVPAV